MPIALYVKSPFMLVVDPTLPIRSVPELIKYIKERPGQISYSSSGVGSAPHLSAEYMKQRFGLDLAHVPYRNSPQSIADVAAGHVRWRSPRPARRCRSFGTASCARWR